MNETFRSSSTYVLFFALIACSGGDGKDTTDTTDTTTPTNDDTTDDTDTVDSAVDSADTGGHTTGGTTPDTWTTTAPCDASHTLATLVLDTTNSTVYVDLDSGSEVGASDAWELSMNTWEVALGSGVTMAAAGGVYAAFDDQCQAPPDNWFGTGATAIEQWYAYDPSDHTLSPQDVVFFLHTSDGAYVRLRFDGYYEDAGALHSPGLTFGPVAAPVGI